jgi:hypothetical protein
MKSIKIIAVALGFFGVLRPQQKEVDFNTTSDLKMETEYASDSSEIRDISSFEGIEYLKIKFTGK